MFEKLVYNLNKIEEVCVIGKSFELFQDQLTRFSKNVFKRQKYFEKFKRTKAFSFQL